MRKVSLVLSITLVFLLTKVGAQKPIFLGGSANSNSSSNIFIGYQFNENTAIIADYYKKNIFSIDILYKGFVLSNGFALKNNQSKKFITFLYTPKIYEFNKKWKIFGKVGINLNKPYKFNSKQLNSIFGIGLRWN